MPTEHPTYVSEQHQLNSYNVAQLQFALDSKPQCVTDPIAFLHDLSPSPSPAVITNYNYRRMSGSATSTADTDSSILSRGEKRPLTPSDSPLPKKTRPTVDTNSWDLDSSSGQSTGTNERPSDAGIDNQKVQLPSISTTFEDNYRHDGRRQSLPVLASERHLRHAPYPPASARHNYTPSHQSSLSSYTFPSNGDESSGDKASAPPKLYTNLNFGVMGNNSSYDSPYPNSGISNGTTPSSSTFSSSTFSSPMNSDYHRAPGISPYQENDNWEPSPIPRPSSTPGHISSPAAKYDDALRHASFSTPMSQAPMFAGSGRISGQQDRRPLSVIKSEQWSFPNPDFVLPSGNTQYSPSMTPAPPSIAVSNSPSRSPQSVSASTLPDRPPRKRGKLPKETTDFLKAWLHRHSDHPYPSEEEKKQLCHATGLSMSQVSNWMINARRRILAPAHRAASGPTTTAPFPPTGRSVSSGLLDSRRLSMPTADSLQLYHPMTLQSMPNTPGHHHHNSHPHIGHHNSHDSDYLHSRHLLNVPSSRHHHGGGGLSYNTQSRSMLYGPHSAGPAQSPHFNLSSDVPLSAPPTLSPSHPFSTHGGGGGNGGNSNHHQQQNMYPSIVPSPRIPPSSGTSAQQLQFYNDNSHSHSGSAPGSGYATPQ